MFCELMKCVSVIGIAYSAYNYVNNVCKSIEIRLCELKSENKFAHEIQEQYNKIFKRIMHNDNELFSHQLKEDVSIIFNNIKKSQEEHNKSRSRIFVHNNVKVNDVDDMFDYHKEIDDDVDDMFDYHKEIDDDIKMLRKMFSSFDINFIIFMFSLLNLTYVSIWCK
jgi:hypothetical protein